LLFAARDIDRPEARQTAAHERAQQEPFGRIEAACTLVRAADMKAKPLTTFSQLGLDPALLKSLEAEGYTSPTPIQAQAIPSLLAGRDLLGIAQTGTGKTAAFALPILHRLAADRRPAPRHGARALILSPTRELATQIAESFKTYGRHLGLSVAVVFGGVGYRPQIDALRRGIDILVATPGRLIDHMNDRNADLAHTEILVLDEADQMMDLGFIRPLRQIIAKLPSARQSMFFSATMPHEIGALAAELLRDPVKVAVTPVAKTADRVSQKVIFVEMQKKRSLLVELFQDPAMTRTLVFTRTKRGADRVARHLEGAGIPVAAIHGNKSQAQREHALAAFKSSRIRALIATDIAARGIDIDQVSHVVNYELPNIPESYVHRIGRTARAGAEGSAISLVDGEERAYLRDIERLTRQSIPNEDRRGDTSLAVPADRSDKASSAGHRGESAIHAERRHGRPNGARNGRGHRHGHGHGGGQGPERGHGRRDDRRSAHRDETRDGNQSRASHASRDGHAHRDAPRQDRSSGAPRQHGRTEAPQRQGQNMAGGQPPRRGNSDQASRQGSGNGDIRNVAFLAGSGGHRHASQRPAGGSRPHQAGARANHRPAEAGRHRPRPE
jgi:ATP-dependent RNA helicase RhlE